MTHRAWADRSGSEQFSVLTGGAATLSVAGDGGSCTPATAGRSSTPCGPTRRPARTNSQLDQRYDGAGRGRSMLAFRSVVSVLLRGLGDFSGSSSVSVGRFMPALAAVGTVRP